MLKLKFFRSDDDRWVAEVLQPLAATETLRAGYECLLMTMHPATAAAALYAMGARSVLVETRLGSAEVVLPVPSLDDEALMRIAMDLPMASWLTMFCAFTQFDFVHPEEPGNTVDLHFRTAVRYLPKELVTVQPIGPEPENVARVLQRKSRYVYAPDC